MESLPSTVGTTQPTLPGARVPCRLRKDGRGAISTTYIPPSHSTLALLVSTWEPTIFSYFFLWVYFYSPQRTKTNKDMIIYNPCLGVSEFIEVISRVIVDSGTSSAWPTIHGSCFLWAHCLTLGHPHQRLSLIPTMGYCFINFEKQPQKTCKLHVSFIYSPLSRTKQCFNPWAVVMKQYFSIIGNHPGYLAINLDLPLFHKISSL